MTTCQIQELCPSFVDSGKDVDESTKIQVFRLSCNGVVVEVSSLGASVTKFLVPSLRSSDGETAVIEGKEGDDNNFQSMDDIVLGYDSVQDMFESGNPFFMGVIVGRVANRIAKGKLQLPNQTIQLNRNDGLNHLHGGTNGYTQRIWDTAEIRSNSVVFTLLSKDGDGGYPGTLLITAAYQLESSSACATMKQNSSFSPRLSELRGVRLSLSLEARLLDDMVPYAPINLAQHSYFNLSCHQDPKGILDHTLHLNGCWAYTPLNEHGIPTRQLVPLTDDETMNLRSKPVLLRQALIKYGVHKAFLPLDQVEAAVDQRTLNIKNSQGQPLSPFGLDHNFVSDVLDKHDNNTKNDADGQEGLTHIATLVHDTSKRRLAVWTSTPGVQVYTANFVTTTPNDKFKDGAFYKPWQGLCLEAQYFPDSIYVDPEQHNEFAKGKCVLLTPEKPLYKHRVAWELEFPSCNDHLPLGSQTESRQNSMAKEDGDDDFAIWQGEDTDGNRYQSIQAMWESQRVTSPSSLSWYERAANHYQNEATLDTVLGGFAPLTDLDLAGSLQFVQTLQSEELQLLANQNLSQAVACEFGAGIGRVSKGLLLPMGFGQVDLVESASHLLAAAPDYIGDEGGADKCRYYCTSLQDWVSSQPGKYTLLWIQWVFCYLTDVDAIKFLEKCRLALVKSGGLIVLKENTVGDYNNNKEDDDGSLTVIPNRRDDFVLDLEDASVTRSVRYLIHLAKQAGLQVVYMQEAQSDFPQDIFPVPMIALAPDPDTTATKSQTTNV